MYLIVLMCNDPTPKVGSLNLNLGTFKCIRQSGTIKAPGEPHKAPN